MSDQAIADQSAERFANAPEAVRLLAQSIAVHGDDIADAIAQLDQETLNASYLQISPTKRPEFGHTLLREAMLARNAEAARLLIAQGADISFNDNEFPFHAVATPDGARDVWFPDYSRGNAMLRVWLEAGGDPQATHVGRTWPLLMETPQNNLEAILILLEAGADPWYRPPLSAGSEMKFKSFFELLISANKQSLEVAFRIAKDGHFATADPEARERLLARVDEIAEFVGEGTGPEATSRQWALAMFAREALPQMDAEPTAALKAQQAQPIGDASAEVGFFLAPGELRSPPDTDQKVTTDNQTGNERWDG